MLIEIWDRLTLNGEHRTVVEINGSGTHHESPEVAYEYLQGKVCEIKSVVDTAIHMHRRAISSRTDATGRGEG